MTATVPVDQFQKFIPPPPPMELAHCHAAGDPEAPPSSSSSSSSQGDLKNGRPSGDEVTRGGPSPSVIRKTDLSLQIPPRQVSLGNRRTGKGVINSQTSSKPTSSASSSSSKSSSSKSRLLRALSFKKRSGVADAERSSLLNSDSNSQPPFSPIIANLTSAFSRCISLPPPLPWSPTAPVPTPVSARLPVRETEKAVVARSLSAPGQNIVIVRSASFAAPRQKTHGDSFDAQITIDHNEGDDEEEIPEEEAVCRICFDACEEENTLKMECACRGDLRLVHESCAIKWFSTKGNKNCEVCCHEVKNLPVILFRVTSCAQFSDRQSPSSQNLRAQQISAWQDFVVLVLISTICYFFFLEQLLIEDMKSQAILIAAPFAFALGVVASIFSVVLAIREFIWTYAALEFALVAVTMNLFYTMLHLDAIYAILLAAVFGFATAMSLNTLYIRYYIWRVQTAQNSIFNASPV